MSQRMVQVSLGGRCSRVCTICECRDGSSPADADGVPTAMLTGGDRLEIRGDGPTMPAFPRVLAAAARARWSVVVVRSHGAAIATPDAAVALRNRGVTGVVLPIFSHVSSVHDRITGSRDALVVALRAMRACAGAGLSVAIEIPLLATRLQDVEAIVRLAHRAVPTLASARFFLSQAAQPELLAPPRWNDARPGLRRALAYCASVGIAVAIRESDAMPLCAIGHDDEFQRLYRLDPRRPVKRLPSATLGGVCARCDVEAQCVGICEGYRAAHGDLDLLAFTKRPRRIYEQRTTPTREWRDDQRAAASRVVNRILRPTVNCNQDCPFCSANETTENVFADPGEMLRRIARMARIGERGADSERVSWLSFSGGEPTLSKDLVEYVRTASRLGIRDIEIVTNGVLIDSPAKVRPLRDAGLTRAFVSLHAHDELLARRTTSKVGDWERTVRAVHAMLGEGIGVGLNHVISSINYPYLPRFADFVAGAFQDRVSVSFAFITPQFKALENEALVPRISDVVPYLRRAMRRMVDGGVPFIVGSRQGIPPCFLGEFVAWSDFVKMSPQAHADDEPQKVRAPQCDRCRFSAQCVGVWKPYAARHGLSELVPVPGDPLHADDIALLARIAPPRSFADVHAALRVAVRDDVDSELPAPDLTLAGRPRRLPLLGSAPARTLRIAMLGSGARAQRLAQAVANVPGLALAGVASPHLLDREPGPFAGLALRTDAEALLDAVRPDAVLIAASTLVHRDLVAICADRGLAMLLEKPIARTLEQADEIVTFADRVLVMPAHNMVFAPGLVAVREQMRGGSFGRVVRASFVKRAPAASMDAPATWSRDGLYQSLIHAVCALGVATGRCAATVASVAAHGSHRPEFVRVELRFDDGVRGDIVLDFASGSAGAFDELSIVDERGQPLVWRRDAADEELTHASPSGHRTMSIGRGSDTEIMLAAFRDAVIGGLPSPVPVRDGRDAMLTAARITDALRDFIARPSAPRHVASPSLR